MSKPVFICYFSFRSFQKLCYLNEFSLCPFFVPIWKLFFNATLFFCFFRSFCHLHCFLHWKYSYISFPFVVVDEKRTEKTVTRFCVPSESIICAVYKNTTNISLTMAFCKAIIELSTPWRWKIKWNRVKKETESKDERKNCKKEPFQFGWMVFVQLSHSHPSSESVYVSVSQR